MFWSTTCVLFLFVHSVNANTLCTLHGHLNLQHKYLLEIEELAMKKRKRRNDVHGDQRSRKAVLLRARTLSGHRGLGAIE